MDLCNDQNKLNTKGVRRTLTASSTTLLNTSSFPSTTTKYLYESCLGGNHIVASPAACAIDGAEVPVSIPIMARLASSMLAA
jgi:hypothetical protein